MNIEFIKLTDGTTAITNEKGEISKREMEVSCDELLTENKIEIIDNSIEKVQNEVKNHRNIVLTSRYFLISQLILTVITAILGYTIGNLNGLINVLAGPTVLYVIVGAFWGVIYPIAKRKLKGFEGKLVKAEELKLALEDELAREKQLVSIKKKLPVNEPVSLAHQTELQVPLIDEQLELAYCEAIHSKPQKLVRKR